MSKNVSDILDLLLSTCTSTAVIWNIQGVTSVNIIICIDADEWTNGKHDCAADADCTNTVGSFNCTCQYGFTGDENTCSGIKRS